MTQPRPSRKPQVGFAIGIQEAFLDTNREHWVVGLTAQMDSHTFSRVIAAHATGNPLRVMLTFAPMRRGEPDTSPESDLVVIKPPIAQAP